MPLSRIASSISSTESLVSILSFSSLLFGEFLLPERSFLVLTRRNRLRFIAPAGALSVARATNVVPLRCHCQTERQYVSYYAHNSIFIIFIFHGIKYRLVVAPSGDSLLLDRRLIFAGEVAIRLRKRRTSQLAQLIYPSQSIIRIFAN